MFIPIFKEQRSEAQVRENDFKKKNMQNRSQFKQSGSLSKKKKKSIDTYIRKIQ